MVSAADAAGEIRRLIDGHVEWLLVRVDGPAFPLTSAEIDIELNGEKVILGLPDDRGFVSWRVNNFIAGESEIALEVAAAFGKKSERLRLVPRTSAKQLSLEIEIARLKRANEIAEAICKGLEDIKVTRVAVGKENSRIAHIFFKDTAGSLNAAMTDVTESSTHESLLSSALLWQAKLDKRKKNRVDKVWIVAAVTAARNLLKLLALLKPVVRESILLAEISEKNGQTVVSPVIARSMGSVWREKAKKLVLPPNPKPTDTAQAIIDLAPDHIDLIYSRQGETLRFAGMPMARVRKMLGQERAWFGVKKDNRVLTHETWEDLRGLIAEVADFRSFATGNSHHEFYRSAPEAWLESILKRNIKLLDANLILSPIYNQFRASNDKIDLLALRKDGRLVIIELKTSPDREMVFQAADYWRKIELQRRQGKLSEADLFAGREILDKPAIVYLVAPAWSFHRDFAMFARLLSKEIEVWRFELHEHWRDRIKVIARNSYSEPGSGL